MSLRNELISELYLQMYDFLLDYAEGYLKNHALAEEAVQDTFRIACEKADSLQASPSPRGWIMNTMKYVLSNIRKNQETARKILQTYLLPEAENYAVTEDRLCIQLLYEGTEEWEALQLIKEYVLDELSYFEMAKRRGISVATCRKRVQRAKETLRKNIFE